MVRFVMKLTGVATCLILALTFLCLRTQPGFAFTCLDSTTAAEDCLRPQSAAGDEEVTARMWGYGFAGAEGVNLAHEKIFRVRAATAFSEGRAIPLFGHQAADLDQAAAEFLRLSGEVGITQADVARRLRAARQFLDMVFSDEFILRIVAQIAGIDEAKVKGDKALAFLRQIKEIAAVAEPAERLRLARGAIVGETRFISFIFGSRGMDPYLYNVGNILSREYRALVAHIGTFPYEGSETLAGGARTIYTSLARIEGFAGRKARGVELFREMMLHEFTDMAYGRHVDPRPQVVAAVNQVNAAIDRTYLRTTSQVVTRTLEEGSVVVSNPNVTIEKYRMNNDLAMRETFAIKGSSRVHPDVPKGQPLSITIAKADVGSIGGHGTAPGIMLEAVAEVWMQAAERGEILDFFITRVGDDISVTVTHTRGKDDPRIHELIWNAFVNAAVIAKDLGFYGAGQDLLATAFSGNVKGAGPSVAEMVIREQKSEVIIIGQADKTAPGAFNQGLWRILFGPSTTWRPLGGGQARDIRVGMLDFDYGEHAGRHIWWTKEDYDDAYWYLGYPDRYTIDSVTLGNGEDFAAVTAQRLGIIAGEYVGKDDPMFMIRSQKAFPAVGEITSAFLTGEYFVPGWMRGSNKGPFFPVALPDARIGIYDGPPLLSMWSFNLNNGHLVGFYDLMAANPAIRYVQDRRAAAAVRQLEEGFHEMALRLGPEEIEYQKGPAIIEGKLEGRWEVFVPKEGAAEQQATDTAWEDAGRQMAAGKTASALRIMLQQRWGRRAAFAEALMPDIHYHVSDGVMAAHTAEGGRVYPILINHEALLRTSPDGIMALENLLEQLGQGNIRFVLHIARDGVDAAQVDAIVDEILAAVNQINGGYTRITRDNFAAVVVGTDPEKVAAQVREAVGTGIFEVIGPEGYATQFKDVIRVVLDPATQGQLSLMSKALRLGAELVGAGGNLGADALRALDALFALDGSGNFHVQSANVVGTVQAEADEYAREVEANVRT